MCCEKEREWRDVFSVSLGNKLVDIFKTIIKNYPAYNRELLLGPLAIEALAGMILPHTNKTNS